MTSGNGRARSPASKALGGDGAVRSVSEACGIATHPLFGAGKGVPRLPVAVGRFEWGRAAFTGARHSADYPPHIQDRITEVVDLEGDAVTRGRHPVVDVESGLKLHIWCISGAGATVAASMSRPSPEACDGSLSF